jgi:hypothetical protein
MDMHDEFEKYHKLFNSGASVQEISQEAQADDLDQIKRIRLIRELSGLSLVDALRFIHTEEDQPERKKPQE